MYEVTDQMPRHARIIILKPDEGWSRAFYDRQIAQYALDRGAAPRTVTLHPETMTALGFSATWVNATAVELAPGPLLVSSIDYAREHITLFE
jgi:hypothetical protein